MKKIISLFLTLCITISMFSTLALNVYAESGTCGNNISWAIENNILTFTGSGELEESPSFSEYNFTSVVFDDRITEIPSEIFKDCQQLSNVTLPENLVYIPYKAFAGCLALKEIVIPDKVAQIASYAFDNTPLDKVTIPQNVVLIGKCAFDGPVGWYIDNVEYTGIKDVYYGGTEQQWNNIKIISGTTDYDGYSTGNQSLSNATKHFNNDIAYTGKCGDNATWEISNNTLHISGTGEIYDYVISWKGYSYPIWLTYDYDTIIIDEGITGIGICAFDEMVVSMGGTLNWKGFGDLSNDEITANELSIKEDNNLYFCIEKVKKIYLPKTLTKIETEAFYSCNRLTDVYYAGTENDWNNIDIEYTNYSLINAQKHYNTSNENRNFEDIAFTDKFFEYDGNEKELTISGTLPDGASVRYTNNKASEAGTYTATAIISADGYNTLTLNATMTIGFNVNNVILPLVGYELGKEWDNCWTFAQNVYQEIWGTDEGEDLLRILDTEDKKITEKNVRNFILSSELGANIRLEDGEDVNIHSLILVQKDNNGFTVYHGNYNGAIYFTYYTYSEFAQLYADYKYFEYILFPEAPEYSKAPQSIALENIQEKTYGDASFAITVTPDAMANLSNFTYDSSDKNVATINESGNVTIVGAGETIISVTEAGNEDYAKTTVTKKLTVNKKALEIKVDNVTITYGDAINTNITYTGFIDGEDETVLTKAVEVGGYSANPNVGEYDIILSGAEAANYEISYVNAKLTVNKKDVTVTQLKVFDKVVDTTTDATINTSSLVIDGMILGDDVTINFENAVATFATAEVGIDIAVTITALELVGAHAENYNLTNIEFATTASIKETITASDVAAQITALTVVKDSTEITLPNVPAGYKVTLKSSDNEDVVKIDGSVAPVENDTPVGLTFTVTNKADETDVADTAVINVTIPASTKINVVVAAEANGTVTGSGEYLKNSDVTVVATPDSGYKFSGWYNGETSVSTSASYTFKAVNDIALVAKFAKQTSSGGGGGSSSYAVKFETNGGSKIANQSIKRNAVVKEPVAPTKEGYIFAGWYTDKELTVAYDFATKVTEGFTLYAKWTEVKEDIDKPGDTEKPDVSGTLLFKDVKTNDWFYENVKYVVENNLMNGISEDEFAPNNTLTRAMLVTVLYRNAGEPTVNKSIPFTDVDMGSWHANAVAWAQQNGIVMGVSETEFTPNANVTREQIAAIIHRYARYKGYDVSMGENTNILSYNDYDSISEYAVTSMQYAVGSGLMKGKSTSTLNPLDNATRAEIATILQRFIENNK